MRFVALVVSSGITLMIAGACSPIPVPTTTSTTPTRLASARPSPQAPLTPEVRMTPSPPTTPVSAVKVLRIGRVAYPSVIDPQKSATGNGVEVLRLVYEGLFGIDDKGNVGPGGADMCNLSGDNTLMICHIRDGSKRADGTPITAKDYEYALMRAVDPRVSGKSLTYLLYDIKGAVELDAMDPASAKPGDIDKAFANYGVKAVDDKTLTVTFKKPVGYWQYIAATVVAFPPDRSQIEKDPDNWWTKPEGHNGNGPFRIKSIDAGKKIVLVPNENYWRGKPKLDRIELIYADSKTLLDAYKRGDIDLVSGIAPDDLLAINQDSSLKAEQVRFPAAITYAVTFNSSRKPFSDKNVRIGFSQALDRDAWVRDVLKGKGKPYTRWIPMGVPGSQPDKPGVPGYDPKAAVLTLVNNGYGAKDSTPTKPKVDCAKLGEVRLSLNSSSPSQVATVQFLVADFVRVFNCPITLEPLDPVLVESLNLDSKTMPQMSLSIWVQDYPYPQDWLSMYWSCSSVFSTRLGYCNKDLDTLLGKADREPDPLKSLPIYQDAEELLLKDVPAAFANYVELAALIKPYVMGPGDHISSADLQWPGEWGPILSYDIDLTRVPANYLQ